MEINTWNSNKILTHTKININNPIIIGNIVNNNNKNTHNKNNSKIGFVQNQKR